MNFPERDQSIQNSSQVCLSTQSLKLGTYHGAWAGQDEGLVWDTHDFQSPD